MFTVYILRNPDGLFYKGVTANLPQRIIDHNSGKSRYTKNKGPWELVWSKVVDSKREALSLVDHIETNANSSTIDISNLSNGLYLITVTEEGKVHTLKFVRE